MRIPFLAIAMLAGFLLLPSMPAAAHAVGISRGEYRTEGAGLRAELSFARPELAAAIPGLDADGDGTLSTQELVDGRGVLERALVDGLEVRTTAGRCAGELAHAELAPKDGVIVGLRYRCAQARTVLSLRLSLLASLSVGHRHLAAIWSDAAGPATQVIYEASPSFEIRTDAQKSAIAGNAVGASLFALGVEHILTGFDHLMFLFGVVVVGGRLRTLLLAVTAFTLAHSVTLGLAVLGVWAPSPSIVEPLIALSIVYVGIENWFVGDASRRWLLTFPFGLVHGFGFAGALQEIALPSAQLPLALLSFNLGVETGQVMVLAVVLPCLLWLRRQSWFALHGVRSASTVVAVAGMAWFVQRVI
jgi:hydrogenase/urease accessory protein HupE